MTIRPFIPFLSRITCFRQYWQGRLRQHPKSVIWTGLALATAGTVLIGNHARGNDGIWTIPGYAVTTGGTAVSINNFGGGKALELRAFSENTSDPALSVSASGLRTGATVGSEQGLGMEVGGARAGILARTGGNYPNGDPVNGIDFALWGICNGTNQQFQYGFNSAGVYGFAPNSIGVAGVTLTANSVGMYGYNDNGGTGIFGNSSGGFGIAGTTSGNNNSDSVNSAGVLGFGNAIGVAGQTTNADSAGVFGYNAGGGTGIIATSSVGNGLYGQGGADHGTGVSGQGNIGVHGQGVTGVYGVTTADGGNAGYFVGNVQVTGTVSGAAKHFLIDHPLDPAHKYLVHASVESSEMLNTYSGNVVMDSDGKAVVDMPTWFEAENGDCRYQLTCVGGYAPVYIDHEIEQNRMTIAGGKPGLKVSWQVTATRQDAYAKAHPLQVEQNKPSEEQGKYLHPAEYGQPTTRGIAAARSQMLPSGLRNGAKSSATIKTLRRFNATRKIPLPTLLPPASSRKTVTPALQQKTTGKVHNQ